MIIEYYDGGILTCEDLQFSYEGGRYVLIADDVWIVPIEEVAKIEAAE